MKRWLAKIVLFLVLGAVLNVAVAWGCELWIDRPNINSSSINLNAPAGEWFFVINSAFGTTKVFSGRVKMPSNGYSSDLRAAQVIPSWAKILMTPTEEYQAGGPAIWEAHEVYGRGWPIRTLWNETSRCLGVGSYIPCDQNYDGILISWPLWSSDAKVRSLPLHPIWRGFAVNTIFYAAILWLVMLGPFTARRMIRRRRGHCIKCDYDLRGLSGGVCPECGLGREVVEAVRRN